MPAAAGRGLFQIHIPALFRPASTPGSFAGSFVPFRKSLAGMRRRGRRVDRFCASGFAPSPQLPGQVLRENDWMRRPKPTAQRICTWGTTHFHNCCFPIFRHWPTARRRLPGNENRESKNWRALLAPGQVRPGQPAGVRPLRRKPGKLFSANVRA